jgi:phosphoserine phosphatase RsbU/P
MADFNSEVKRTFTLLRDDLLTSHVGTTFRRESQEIKDFYLSEGQREELKGMNRGTRAIFYSGWVLKALFFKLTPFRRLLFVFGMLMLFGVNISNNNVTFNTNGFFGGLLLVLLILLELKDKLLAHDELHEGRHIQELLMPQRVQNVNGWAIYLYTRSANEVCGDLVDFLRLEKPYAAVAIADVAGKGLHAALLTAKLQATMRALAFDERSIVSLVSRINTIFHRDSPARMFASLVYAVVSENDGEIRFVNAGHLPPIAIRNGVIEETEKGEIAVGLTHNVEYREHALQLNDGDLFIMYSDGVTEAKNEDGIFYRRERLLTLLKRAKGSPEQICSMIVGELDRFMGQTHPSDDLSLIILRRSSPPVQ